MKCDCYQNKDGIWIQCPDCEHDKWLVIEEERRLSSKMLEDGVIDD